MQANYPARERLDRLDKGEMRHEDTTVFSDPPLKHIPPFGLFTHPVFKHRDDGRNIFKSPVVRISL